MLVCVSCIGLRQPRLEPSFLMFYCQHPALEPNPDKGLVSQKKFPIIRMMMHQSRSVLWMALPMILFIVKWYTISVFHERKGHGCISIYSQREFVLHVIVHTYIDGFVQERCNYSALAMELHLSCTNPSLHDMTWGVGFDWTIFWMYIHAYKTSYNENQYKTWKGDSQCSAMSLRTHCIPCVIFQVNDTPQIRHCLLWANLVFSELRHVSSSSGAL